MGISAWRRPLTFAAIGVINTGVDFAALSALILLAAWPTAAANVASYCCGLTCSYYLNRNWTFRDRLPRPRLGAAIFVGANLVGLVINTAVVALLAPTAGVLAAKVCATVATFATNYAFSSRVAFPVPYSNRSQGGI